MQVEVWIENEAGGCKEIRFQTHSEAIAYIRRLAMEYQSRYPGKQTTKWICYPVALAYKKPKEEWNTATLYCPYDFRFEGMKDRSAYYGL